LNFRTLLTSSKSYQFLNNAIKVLSGPRFSKQLLFCKNTYYLRFSAQNSYQSIGAFRQRPPQINQKNAPDRG